MIILYDFGNSVCCQKVRITLTEKNLDWQAIPVNLFKAEQYEPKYLKLNPKGLVPTLVHNGHAITESTLICEYLDETFPDPPLSPKEPAQRARMRLWSKFVDEGLFEGVTEISFSAMFRERMRTMPEEVREVRFRNIGDPRRRDRFMSTYEFGAQSPYVVHAVGAYERAFKLMEETLAAGGPWILGKQVTLADIAMMPFVARLSYLGLARSVDRQAPAHQCLVAARAAMAELQARLKRSHYRDRIRRDANARAENPRRSRRTLGRLAARDGAGVTRQRSAAPILGGAGYAGFQLPCPPLPNKYRGRAGRQWVRWTRGPRRLATSRLVEVRTRLRSDRALSGQAASPPFPRRPARGVS